MAESVPREYLDALHQPSGLALSLSLARMRFLDRGRILRTLTHPDTPTRVLRNHRVKQASGAGTRSSRAETSRLSFLIAIGL